jgi:hypothetical protein
MVRYWSVGIMESEKLWNTAIRKPLEYWSIGVLGFTYPLFHHSMVT